MGVTVNGFQGGTGKLRLPVPFCKKMNERYDRVRRVTLQQQGVP